MHPSYGVWATRFAWANFAAMWGVIALIHLGSERWWVTTAIIYLPRIPWLIPSLILIPFSLKYAWKSTFLNLGAVLLVLGPIMNWQCGGLSAPEVDPAAYRLTIVSCNVQTFEPDFPAVVDEINRIKPDVILFQEAFEDHPLLQILLEGWTVHRHDEYLAASKLPLKFVETCHLPSYDRITAVRYELETPSGTIALFNVHQTSPRHSLTELKPWSVLNGAGINLVKNEIVVRELEAIQTRKFTVTGQSKLPVLVAGDFNMPNDSNLFQESWGSLVDAYATTAIGYGYTSPCDTKTFWPTNTPWAQVDHILTSRHWQVERCWVGKSGGSDHRLIAAQLRLPQAP